CGRLGCHVLHCVYLQNFSPLDKTCTNHSRRSASYLTERLKQIQAFFSLNVTGHLNAPTSEIMKTPRCGVPDVKQYRVMNQQVHWLKKALTYSIATYTSQLPSATVNHLISSALKVWSDVSPLTFIPSSTGKADIMIRFARRAHGDSQPFDGPGGTVAHAFGPGVGIGGDAHFDGDEKWSAEHNGINLYLVAAHEFGHSLGLPHSRNPASLMYPTYQKRRLQGSPLSFEDVHRIQTLYGMGIYIRKDSKLGRPCYITQIIRR
uniref:Peptidase metallopeptidase domain-containing protein n=1 Tax=Crocodylus porosus TaxID=8502 RepID=A0A7M4G0U8_CROPO